MEISPGNFPRKGILPEERMKKPASISIIPKIMSNFPVMVYSLN